MRNKITLSILFIFVVLISFQQAEAIGLAHGPLKHNFQPGGEIIISFRVLGFDNIEAVDVSFEGNMVEYATRTEIDGDDRFYVTINLPEYIEEPGTKELHVSVFEDKAKTGFVAANTRVTNVVQITVPFDGKYLKLRSITSPDISLGETGHFLIELQNLGNTQINSVYADIKIYDNTTNKLVDEIRTNNRPLDSFEINTLEASWNNIPNTNGIYRSEVIVNYDGQELIGETSFKVGELFVEIIEFSNEIEKSRTAPLDILVESKWNSEIRDVYASILINNTKFKSYPVDLPPWETQNMTAYIDTSEYDIGVSVPVEITLHYSGETNSDSGEVEIVPSGFSLDQTTVIYVSISLALVLGIYILRKLNINITIKKKK